MICPKCSFKQINRVSKLIFLPLIFVLGITVSQNSNSWNFFSNFLGSGEKSISLNLIEIYENFIEEVNQGGIQQAHERLYSSIQSLDGKVLDASSYKDYIHKQNIPYDYRYFFRDYLPHFFDGKEKYDSSVSGKNILTSLPSHSAYQASMVFNRKVLTSVKSFLKPLKDFSSRRLIVTGGYTSPLKIPAGLAINKGKIINPALQKWDGFLIIDSDGKIHIADVNQINYQFRQFNLHKSYEDYRYFLKIASREKLTVIQSHLLINQGKILTTEGKNSKIFRRRVVFGTADGGIHVYDSLEQVITLHALAKTLKEQYDAQIALNLDMGIYNYGMLYNKKGKTKDYSSLGQNIILSNVLVIDY